MQTHKKTLVPPGPEMYCTPIKVGQRTMKPMVAKKLLLSRRLRFVLLLLDINLTEVCFKKKLTEKVLKVTEIALSVKLLKVF